MTYVRVALLVLALALPASGQDSCGPLKPWDTGWNDCIKTNAGLLRIVEIEHDCRYEVRLDDALVYKTDCKNPDSASNPVNSFPIPTVLMDYRGGGNFTEIVVLHHASLGTACGSGPIFVLELHQHYPGEATPRPPFKLSKLINYCGGSPPVLVVGERPDQVRITLHGGPGHLGGWAKGEEWVYRDGDVHKLRDIDLYPLARPRKQKAR